LGKALLYFVGRCIDVIDYWQIRISVLCNLSCAFSTGRVGLIWIAYFILCPTIILLYYYSVGIVLVFFVGILGDFWKLVGFKNSFYLSVYVILSIVMIILTLSAGISITLLDINLFLGYFVIYNYHICRWL
jgi:hypothetical protein